jgi:hypothetical protein
MKTMKERDQETRQAILIRLQRTSEHLKGIQSDVPVHRQFSGTMFDQSTQQGDTLSLFTEKGEEA